MKKIIISFMFTILCMFILTNVSFAAVTSSNSLQGNNGQLNFISQKVPDDINNFVINRFPLMKCQLEKNQSDYALSGNEASSLQLGHGFNLFSLKNGAVNNENIYYYLVTYQNKVKMILTAGYNTDNSIWCSLGSDFSDKLSNIVSSIDLSNPIIIVKNNDKLFIQSNQGAYKISTDNTNLKMNDTNSTNVNDINKVNCIDILKNNPNINIINSLEPQAVGNLSPDVINNSISSSVKLNDPSPYGYNLEVPIVWQGYHSDCWAACVACLCDWKEGVNLDPLAICAYEGIPADGDDSGAYPYQAQKALKDYGLLSTYFDFPLSINDINNNLYHGNPIFMGNSGHDSAGKAVGHATVLRGALFSSQGILLTIMNPQYQPSQGYEILTLSGNYNYRFVDTNGILFTWDNGLTLN